VDVGQIRQVLTNLVSNARDAMNGRGTLQIEAGASPIPGEQTKEECAFFGVRDAGPGISEAVQRRIFEPFFTTKEIGKGTGLGLSVVSGIVEQHHGRITVESIPGRGAVFTVYLPLAEMHSQTRDFEVP